MTFLADESVDGSIVAHLREDGHTVLYVAEMEPGITDEVVLERSNQAGAVLLTEDKDFGELVFLQKRTDSGVVLFRLHGLPSATKASIASAAVRQHGSELPGSFTVVTPTSVRIRLRLV